MVGTTTFNDIQSLYKDMVSNYQSFTKGGSANGIEYETPYREVKIRNRKLDFHSNQFGGAHLRINGNIKYAKKVDKPDNNFSEYRIYIEGREQPLVLMACKK